MGVMQNQGDLHEMEEPQTPPTAVSPQPPVIELRQSGNGRTALWVLLSVFVGFMLPVCSCALLFGASIAGLSTLDTSGLTAPVDTGVGPAVAIVRVEGTIVSSDDGDLPGPTSGRIIADLRSAEADLDVKAIVLRIDSPGGGVTAAAQIYEVITTIEKPIVVSMAGTAASGGYYISAPTDYIMARPDTFTGSLGVVLTLFNAEELIDEIGVDVIAITSGENKSIGSPWEEITPEQRAIFDSLIDEAYQDFVAVIVDGRNLPRERVLEMADGRIYTGRQALELGLVDELGNLQDAIAEAADRGGISGEPRIIEYDRLPGLDQFLAGFSARFTRTEADEAIDVINQMTAPRLEYRMWGALPEEP